MSAPFADLLTATGALAAVLGLIWLSHFAVRRWGRFARPSSASGRLGVVQSLALDPRRRIVLMRCDGREFLLLTGGAQDLMLGFLPGPEGS